jgi:S-adenosylmethionine:tRNA ribosyltransferase-isomerase
VHISDFDYELPEELIAQHPLPKRDASRMLIVHRATGAFEDKHFVSLPDYLRAGDCLVLNDTKVFPARLSGRRLPTGGSVEILLLREIEAGRWQVLARPARRLQVGSRIEFGQSKLNATVVETVEDGTRIINFEPSDKLLDVIQEIGKTPLPPYIKRHTGAADEDRDRYQTIYAQQSGAIAAPTAGLHFTPRVLQELKQSDVRIAEITLHVGYGTFEPVRVDNVAEHRVLAERFTIPEEGACIMNDCRRAGGRVVAVGTTTTRALESSVSDSGEILAANDMANLTIRPGYSFRAVDALLTNFHLPRSSLLLLVSAFAGRTLVLEAYRHAVGERYRFYSYGDCMLIL